MQVAADRAVFFEYTLTNDDGQTLDSSRTDGREPLGYIHGKGGIIPGLEKEMSDKAAGDKFQVEIAPGEAYGEYNDQLVQDVPREVFKEAEKNGQAIEPGLQFQAQTQAGPHNFRVLEVSDETVKIDGNHPLAGQTLHFDIELTEVREATDEEKEHGHVHGPGGHQH